MPKPRKKNTGKDGKQKNRKQQASDLKAAPWISMRSGLQIITITSIGMAILTAYQVIPQRGWLEGIFWGLLFGVLIWAVFFGFLFFNRLIKR